MTKPHLRPNGDGTFTQVHDGIQNVATRLGGPKDKASGLSYSYSQLQDDAIEQAYRSSWIVRKAVDIPVMDATRKWRDWNADDEATTEVIAAEETRLGVQGKVRQSKINGRLFGGAALLIGLRSQQDFSRPIQLDRITQGDFAFLTVLEKSDLSPGEVETDPTSQRFGMPRWYEINTGSDTFDSVRIDPSWLVEMHGNPRPRRLSAGIMVADWSDTVLDSMITTLRHADGVLANMASLVGDAKTDVVKIPGLSRNIANKQYELDLITRFEAARMIRGNQGTFILDQEEEYESVTYAFAGMAETVDRFLQAAAGAADIPLTRFLGQSPGGMNATGDSDLTNYYDRVAAMQSTELSPAMRVLDECLIRSALGDRPEDVSPQWRPLKQMTEAETADIRAKTTTTIKAIAETRLYSDEDVARVGAKMLADLGVKGLDEAGPGDGQEEDDD